MGPSDTPDDDDTLAGLIAREVPRADPSQTAAETLRELQGARSNAQPTSLWSRATFSSASSVSRLF